MNSTQPKPAESPEAQKSVATRRTDRVDLHIAARITTRRREQDVGTPTLSKMVGVSTHQIQKYEKGRNRVSAAKLHEIAFVLRAPISYFFAGLGDPTSDDVSTLIELTPRQGALCFLMTGEGMELADLFLSLKPGMRRCFLAMLQAFSDAA